jgi:hypothetical protein
MKNNRIISFIALCAGMCATLSAWTPLARGAAPNSSAISYKLFRNGIELGVITEQFETSNGSYQATSEARATGMFALMQRQPIRYHSVGELTPHGLRPQRFEGYQAGKSVSADFDWSAGTLTLNHDGLNRALALPPDAQDRLSIMYQLLFSVRNKASSMDFTMTNGRKIERYRYVAQSGVSLATPFRKLDTIHLVKQRESGTNDTETEVWLASEYGYLPVKVLIVEKDGVRYEQIVTHLEIKP